MRFYRQLLPIILGLAILTITAKPSTAQYKEMKGAPAVVDFSEKIRAWDGFGFNYVETSQTTNYQEWPQDYGGFSLLDEQEKQKIIDLVFGKNGLQPGLVKMFLDPWHQDSPEGEFDHTTTTVNMREFVRRGLEKTQQRDASIEIVTTLYGPPAWATKQKFLRGRDLDPKMKDELADYMIDWIKFLKEEEEFPVKYLSLHNEGEDWKRWPKDGSDGNIGTGHDYNLFWPPQQVVEFLEYLPGELENAGLEDIGVTPGETTGWFRFYNWGYANAIYNSKEATENLGLITSHGFFEPTYYDHRWFNTHMSAGIDLIREKRPEIHAWVTSTSWSDMDAKFVREIYGNIYSSKVNGLIPWAGIQRPEQWVGGDPNPGCAIQVYEDGSYEVRRGYYFYKQVTRAGQPDMAVVQTSSMDAMTAIIAFASNGTENPNAFVVINTSDETRPLNIEIRGTDGKTFKAYRTNRENERYKDIGTFKADEGQQLFYEAPKGSVTTFYEKE